MRVDWLLKSLLEFVARLMVRIAEFCVLSFDDVGRSFISIVEDIPAIHAPFDSPPLNSNVNTSIRRITTYTRTRILFKLHCTLTLLYSNSFSHTPSKPSNHFLTFSVRSWLYLLG
jgi:hypothetical protein